MQPTAEQIRIAQITDVKGGSEDPKIREKVQNLMEMTQRSEEDVCCALYECDNDLDRAVIFLLEQLPINAFATSTKKKKNKSKEEKLSNDNEWADSPALSDSKEKQKLRSNTSSELKNNSNRTREKRRNENETALSFKVDTFRSTNEKDRNRSVRGGGARGSNRSFANANRSNYRSNKSRTHEHQEIDSWDASQGITLQKEKQQEITIDTWGDWDNEEYTGSLNDTKVFTPSTLTLAPENSSNELGVDKPIQKLLINQVESLNDTNLSKSNTAQYSDIHSSQVSSQHLSQNLDLASKHKKSLSEEQSQYFNTLSSKNTLQYNSTYADTTQFGSDHLITSTQGSQMRRQRARVPPPSKIPLSAVEMPSDTLNSAGSYLDVQFGGLDLGNEDTFDSLTEKFNASSLEGSSVNPSKDVNEFNIKSGHKSVNIQNTHLLPNTENLSQVDSLTSRSPTSGSTLQNNPSAFSINKSDGFIHTGNSNYNSTFSTTAKISYPNSYGSSSFATSQVK